MRALPLVLVLLLTPLTTAHGQERSATADRAHRSGGWFGIGLTFGLLSEVPSDRCRDYAATINAQAGGTISPRVRLGGELDLGVCDEGIVVASALVHQLYSEARSDLFFKAGIGVRVFTDIPAVEDYVDQVVDLTGIVGAGYDLCPASARYCITPFAQLAFGITIHDTAHPASAPWNTRLWQFGVAVTWP
jgi:hypothetical protein